MFEQGFRDFVGVDGSEGMLLEAEKTGLYSKLELAILGPETLPAATGTRQRPHPATGSTAPLELYGAAVCGVSSSSSRCV